MSVEWLFEIDEAYYFSTKTTIFGGQPYTGIILPNSFRNLPAIRVKCEMNNHATAKFSFQITDDSSTYDISNFENKKLVVRLIIDDVESKAWRFLITTAEESYKKWTITAKDYLSTLVEGVWPNTGLVKDIFPEALAKTQDQYSINEDACVPMIFGTAYIPLQSLGDSGTDEVFFVLGEAGPTYSISEMTSPHEQDGQTVYTSGITYTQSTISSQRVFEPSYTALGEPFYWRNGIKRLSPLVKYSRSDTVSMTNIIDVIKYIIKDFGAIDADFDSTSWTAAVSAMTSRGMTFQRGYYKQETKISILCNLLTLARATLVIGETIEIYLDTNASSITVSTSNITKQSKEGPGTFRYTKSTVTNNNSGNIEFSEANKPEDVLVNAVVPFEDGGSVSDPVSQTLKVLGITDTQDAQRIGILHYQKLLNKIGQVTFTSPYNTLYRPGKTITISDAGGLYGITKYAEIDSLKYNSNSTIEVECIVRATGSILDDWGDLTPSTITTETSPSTNEITGYTKAQDYVIGKWDGTDTTTNFQAELWNSMINGNTFIVGGYINTDYVKVNSALIVGNIDWGTIDGTGKPDDNADVTGSKTSNNTDNVGSYAASVYNNWVVDGTLIYGDLIKTGTIALNRLIGNAGTLTIEGTAEVIIADGGDLELQSNSDSTSMLKFTRDSTNYIWDARLSVSGATFQLSPRYNTANNLSIGSSGYLTAVSIESQSVAIQTATGTSIGYINASANNVDIRTGTTSSSIIYQFASSELSPATVSASPPTLGSPSYHWGAAYITTLNGSCITDSYTGTSSTIAASRTAVNSVYNIANHSHPYALNSHTTSTSAHAGYSLDINLTGSTAVSGNMFPASAAVYSSGTYGLPWSCVFTNYLAIGFNLDANVKMKVKGSTTGVSTYTFVGYNSLSAQTFHINDSGAFRATSDGRMGNCYPIIDNTGFCGIGGANWLHGYFQNLHYNTLYTSFDALDDLQVLEDMGPVKDQDGKPIPQGRGFKGIRQRDVHPAITNLDELPSEFKKEFDIDLTVEDLEKILKEEKNSIKVQDIIVDKQYLDDPNGYEALAKNRLDVYLEAEEFRLIRDEGGTRKIDGPVIDADFIESRLFTNMGKESQLVQGAIRQLNKEVTEDVMEEMNTLIEDLTGRITKLENNN